MTRPERAIVIAALVYMALYIPFFFVECYRLSTGVDVSPSPIFFPAHFFGMALNLIAGILTIRDLYLRSFDDPNTKLTWLLAILLTGGIGWLVYVFKHAMKPRQEARPKSG